MINVEGPHGPMAIRRTEWYPPVNIQKAIENGHL
jgi:hypothetical protein